MLMYAHMCSYALMYAHIRRPSVGEAKIMRQDCLKQNRCGTKASRQIYAIHPAASRLQKLAICLTACDNTLKGMLS